MFSKKDSEFPLAMYF